MIVDFKENENKTKNKIKRRKTIKPKKTKKAEESGDDSKMLNSNDGANKNKTNKEEAQQKNGTKTNTPDENGKFLLFADRFEINSSRMLGKGSFGEIYIAHDLTSMDWCALKLESQKKNSQLRIEKLVLELATELDGFPKLISYGSQNESNYMAMELLGPNLSDLYDFCIQKFSLQTVILLGVQMLTRIQDLHSKNYIHRDIKPENFLIGINDKSNMVFVIDFGLAKKYKDSKMDHMPYKEHRPLTGTARYASINNHLGIEQSRRDDLEAIGYVLLYFLKKKLPWQGCQGSTKLEKYNKILEKKLSLSSEILCKDLPPEFAIYMNYVKNLRYNERPDYNFVKGLFVNLLHATYNEKFLFDWTLNTPDDLPNIKIDSKFYNQNNPFSSKLKKSVIEENKNDNNDENEEEKLKKNKTQVEDVNDTFSEKTEENVMKNIDGDDFLKIVKTLYSEKGINKETQEKHVAGVLKSDSLNSKKSDEINLLITSPKNGPSPKNTILTNNLKNINSRLYIIEEKNEETPRSSKRKNSH